MTQSDDSKEVLETDPTLRHVGDKIDDARAEAQKIFGEHNEDGVDRTTGEPTDEDAPDEDLGGAAPVP